MRSVTSVACPALHVAAALALAANGIACQGVSLGADPAVVGNQFAILGSLDSTAMASSPNLVPIGLWTPTSWPGGVPGQAPGQPPVDGWPALFLVRLTAGAVVGNLYASAEPSSLATAPESVSVGLPVGSMSAPITVPGARTRIQLAATATLGAAVDLWVGDADLSGLSASSVTTFTPALGQTAFTVQAGKSYLPGMKVRIAASLFVYMDATVVTYIGTTLLVNVTAITGPIGSHSFWTVNFIGDPPGYRYITRLHGGGQSVEIGVGTSTPSGLYLYGSPVSGAPGILYAQGIADQAGGSGSLITPGTAVIQGGTGVDITAVAGAIKMATPGGVGIGADPPGTGLTLDLESTSQAFGPPRLTAAQIATLSIALLTAGTQAGPLVFNVTTGELNIWTGAAFWPPTQAGSWAANESLYGGGSGVAQYLASYAASTAATPLAPILLANPGSYNAFSFSFVGNSANVGGQTVSFSIERSTDHGATWETVGVATAGLPANSDAPSSGGVEFDAPIVRGPGEQVRAVATVSADLTAMLTSVLVALR